MREISILLVDDHLLVRQGIRMLLEEEKGLKVVAETESGDEAIPLAQFYRPDVILMDVHMPKGIDGITATRRIKEELPGTHVLMLTMYDDEPHLEKMLQAGASGVVFKHDSSQEIIQAVQTIVRDYGQPYLPAKVALPIRTRLFASVKASSKNLLPMLSPRETEVLALIAKGHTNKEIADRLHISIKTVESHRSHIISRLGAESRADLIEYAVNYELITRNTP